MRCASGSPPTLGPAVALRSSEQPAAIHSIAGARGARLRACGRPARRTTSRSCGGGARPGPRRGTSDPSSCRSMRRSTSSLPRASSGSTPDAHSVRKHAKSNSGNAVKTRERLFSELKEELELQMRLEEQHLFPVLRKRKETEDLVPDALNDNKETRKALTELERGAVGSDVERARRARVS